MRIGVSLNSSLRAEEPAAAAALMIERAATAHRAGLSSLSVGDHHAERRWYHQNVPMLGRLLAEWTERPAGCLFLLPLWHPVLLAEQVGTLAALVDAPFIVQTGIGRGESQFASMSADISRRGRVSDETIRVVKALLAGETAESESLGVGPTQIGLRPNQPVEWWIGGHAPAALERAAREGDAWYAGPGLSLDESSTLIEQYHRACRTRGSRPRAIVRQDALVLADGGSARVRAEEIVAAGYRGMGLEQLLVGDPGQVQATIEQLERVGFDEVIVRCIGNDQAVALETLELLGELNRGLGGP